MTPAPSETIIRQAVRDRYAKLALQTECCGNNCCADSPCSNGELDLVPEDAAQVAAGCGSPLSYTQIEEGQFVVDLGSGGGIDVFRAANLVGPRGKAIGIDATPEMVWRARETAAKNRYVNVEFRLGEIEHIPVETSSADWVVSNCVINLAPDKAVVFKDAFRILKPGGQLVVSDIVSEGPNPGAARSLMTGWAACTTGAIPENEYLAQLSTAGFREGKILERRPEINLKQTGLGSEEKLRLSSLTISAVKPAGL